MKKKKKKDIHIDKFYWLEMPLSMEELGRMEESHRTRPHYIFASNNNGVYYGFYCTSKDQADFVFSKDYVELGKSHIKLSRCFSFSESLLTDDSICEDIPKVTYDKMDEIMKKLKHNYGFMNYPVEVRKRINEYMKTCEYTTGDILIDKKSKNQILVIAKTSRYLCVNLTYVPTKGYAEVLLDGYKCYIDILNPFYLDNLDDYGLENVSSLYEEIIRQNPDDIVYVTETLDTSDLKNLPLGTVISTVKNGRTYILIKLEQHKSGIDYLVKEKDFNTRSGNLVTIPYNHKFKYRFEHILGDEKLVYTNNVKKRQKKLL